VNPACSACKGACCETLVLPMPRDPEAAQWITLRGRKEGATVRLTVTCNELTKDGKCGIHEYKPHACRVYDVGSPACIAAIRAQRPKEAAQLIKLARENQGE